MNLNLFGETTIKDKPLMLFKVILVGSVGY